MIKLNMAIQDVTYVYLKEKDNDSKKVNPMKDIQCLKKPKLVLNSLTMYII